MELQELKEMWSEYDKKLDKSLQLNMQMLRKMNFDKAGFKLKMLFIYKIAEMTIFMYLISWFSTYAFKYFTTPRFGIPALVIDLFVLLGFVSDLRQISIIIQVQMENYNDAIAPLQKKLETLKVGIVNHVKYSYFVIPFYPLMMILGGKIFYNVDFFDPQFKNYLVTNVIIGLALIPVVILPFWQLSKKEITPGIVKNFLQCTGWRSINSAKDFLSEIEKFEQEG